MNGRMGHGRPGREPPEAASVTRRRRITLAGKSVILEVQRAGFDRWRLLVLGKGDQVSEWLEFFDSDSEAMAVGLLAIRHEGIDGFFEDPALRKAGRQLKPAS